MTEQELGEFLKEAGEEGERFRARVPNPIASIYVSREGNSMEVNLDNSKSCYGDWIPGEGGDITINRDQVTKKVTGAHLPLYAKTLCIGGDNFETITIDLTTGQLIPESAE